MMAAVNGASSPSKVTSAEKRAVHNALERKRRDHIKDMFSQLKDSVPNLSGEKVNKASRAQIMKKACDYIQLMRRKNGSSTKELEARTQQIARTRKQIAKLESVRNTTRYVSGLSPAQVQVTAPHPDPHSLPAASPPAAPVRPRPARDAAPVLRDAPPPVHGGLPQDEHAPALFQHAAERLRGRHTHTAAAADWSRRDAAADGSRSMGEEG